MDDCKKPLHMHLMVRGHATHRPTDKEEVVEWLTDFVSFLDMKLLQGPYASYVDAVGNRGMTATAMIETSHIAFHVWDEKYPSLVQFDVYTCGSLNILKTLDKLNEYFQFSDFEYLAFDREYGFREIMSGENTCH